MKFISQILQDQRILPLRDNALFLQNWRERTRSASVISAAALATIIILLILLYSYFNVRYGYQDTAADPQQWLRMSFYSIAYLQGIILLLLGTMSIDRMTVRERASGTLEYHRSSPTSRVNQYFGILLGAPSLEWCIFLGSLSISVLLMLATNISFLTFFRFYAQLILVTFFYHSLAILLAVCANQRTLLTHRRFSAVHVVVIMLFMGGAFMYSYSSSLYHLSWYPAYQQLTIDVFKTNQYTESQFKIMHSFFGAPLPSLIMQMLVQVPLLVLFIVGIMRQISRPDYPIFSKPHSALTIFFLLFLFIGSSDSYLKYANLDGYQSEPLTIMTPMFVIFILTLGILGALSTTPTRLLYQKGLRRLKKLNQSNMGFSDDHNSNMYWLITVCFLITVTFGVYSLALPVPVISQVLALLIILFRVIFFASIFEYFQLCPHHRKASLFWTAISFLWFFLPLTSTIITKERMTPFLYYLFQTFSPFWGMVPLTGLLLGTNWMADPSRIDVTVDFTCNFVMTVLAVALAARERARCRAEILK